MEYIEREAAVNAILKLTPKVDEDGYCWVIRGDAARAIDSIPAADVRPVVTCAECVHRHDWKRQSCQGRRPDFFCADGEKREES